MSFLRPESSADAIENYMQMIGIAFAVMAFLNGMEAAQFLVSESTAQILDNITFGMAILMVAIFLPLTIHYVYQRRKDPASCREPESFILENFKKAGSKAFALTFVFIVFLKIFMKNTALADLPAKFFLEMLTAFTVGVFAIAFFMLNRGSDNEAE